MSDRPLLFISAVSAEHRSLRGTVAALLDHEGYDTDFQEVLGTEHGDICAMLARHVDACDGVIQLVGQCYGFAAPAPHPQFGPCSYTQFEALYACSIGKPVRYILLDPTHPSDADPTKPEPPEQQALQAAYRQCIEADTALYHRSKTVAETENCIYRLRPVLEELRKEWRARMERQERELRRLRPLLIVAGVTLIALIGVGLYFGTRERQHAGDAAQVKQDTTDIKAALTALAEAQSEKAKEAKAEGKTLADYSPEELLADYARLTQRDPAAVLAVIEAALSSDDLSVRSEGLMLKRQFPEAAVLSRQAGDAKAGRLKDLQTRTAALAEEAALDYRREGVAHYYQLHYPPAISAFETALEQVTRTSHPETWAMLQNDLANTLQEHGIRTNPAKGNKLLARAVTAYSAALEVRTREALPQDWAGTQNNLASALKEQGSRTEGQLGLDLLDQAVIAYRAALEVYTRESLPEGWAMAQSNLAIVKRQQGIRRAGQAGLELLGQAVSSCRAALEVYTREALPEDWAKTQNNLALALQDQANRSEGKAGLELLRQAVIAYRAALAVYTRDALPQQWAMTQNNLANTLKEQGIRSEGQAGLGLLEQAISACRAAQEVYTREALPQQWATTQSNLASALKEQGVRSQGQAGLELLQQAVNAYRAALEVQTHDALPQDWAMTNNNLAAALQTQGSRSEGQAGLDLLGQAVSAYRAAQEVYTREALPQQWAATENNLANALWSQGIRSEGLSALNLLKQAVVAYDAALEVRTREALPQDWAATQNNLGAALMAQGLRTLAVGERQWLYREAEAAYLAALEVRTKEALPYDHQQTQKNLDILRAKMAGK